MSKWFTRYLFVFLFPFIIIAQNQNSNITQIRSIYEAGKVDKSLQLSLLIIEKLESTPSRNPVELFKAHILAGEINLSFSDIEEAFRYWQKAYKLCKTEMKDKPIYLSEVYSGFSQYFNFRMKIDSAFLYANLAIKECRINKKAIDFIPAHKVYRNYAIALKAKLNLSDYTTAREEAKLYLDTARLIQLKFFPNDNFFEAKILKDLGNIQTDLVLYYKRQNQPIKQTTNRLVSANEYYDKAINLLVKKYGNKHPAVAETYFSKGLSYSYFSQFDSLKTVCTLYQKAICSLAPCCKDLSYLSCPYEKTKFLNPTLAITLLRFKLDAMYLLYKQTYDLKILESIYQQSQTSVKIWQDLFAQLRTREIQIALETYGASPFGGIIKYANTYYQFTKDNEVKNNVFKWINLNKYSAILKDNLDGNSNSIMNFIDLDYVQNKLDHHQAILDFYVSSGELVCLAITKNKSFLYPNKEISHYLRHCDTLLNYLHQHNSKKYCESAKLLYDSLIQSVLKDLPSNIKHIIVCPHDRLTKLPFDALVINKTSHYKTADFLINHFNISYALSTGLLFEDSSKHILSRTMTLINPMYQRQSDLPFSRKVMDEIKGDFEINKSINEEENASILHVSAHSISIHNDSRGSYILESDTSIVTMNDLIRNKQHYKLGILTACETARGDIELGEGVINFSRALFLAETKSSITTLWKVDDQETSEINRRFYKQLLGGSGAIESLYESKLEFLKNPKSIDDYDPYYWAGLVYTGQDVWLESKSILNIALTFIVVAIGFIVVVILIRKFRMNF